MNCDSPILVKDKKGYLCSVPCGHCLACRMHKSKQWSARIVGEASMYEDNCFITLTYDEEHCPYSLNKRDLQLFMKSFRQSIYPKKIRYFACGEYGSHPRDGLTTGRPHYHIIVFGLNKYDMVFKRSVLSKLFEGSQGFSATLDAWSENGKSKGNVFVGDVTPQSAKYVSGYVMKKQGDSYHDSTWYKVQGLIPPFVLMSRRPGIGATYADKYKARFKHNPFIVVGNSKIGLPRYLDNRLFSDDMQRKMEKMRAIRQDFEDGLLESQKAGLSYGEWLAMRQEQSELNLAKKLSLSKKGKC